MILYNVTVALDPAIHEEWFDWMKNKHIPAVMATGKFEEWKMFRVLNEEEGGITYSIQYFAKDMKTLQEYSTQFAPQLQRDHQEKYEGKIAAFRTLLEQV